MVSSNESNNAILLLAQNETGFKLAPSSYVKMLGVKVFCLDTTNFAPGIFSLYYRQKSLSNYKVLEK